MLKRTITGFFILLFVVGFTALREVSILFFDALVLTLILLISSKGLLGRTVKRQN